MPIKITELDNKNTFINEEDFKPIFDRSNPIISAVACHKIPDIAILDQKRNLIDYKVVREHFKNEGRLTENQIIKIFTDSNKILIKEDNLIKINKKTFVIGDTHGQYYDLLEILDQFDLKLDTLLFLGDYVDRGSFGCEVYLYLLLLKIHFPNNIFLLRGNHESQKMTEYFTFKSECTHKYSNNIYNLFLKSFNSLPLAAIIQNKAFCCHGGISNSFSNSTNNFNNCNSSTTNTLNSNTTNSNTTNSNTTNSNTTNSNTSNSSTSNSSTTNISDINDINNIDRFREINYNGLFCDLLWSDPNPNFQSNKSFSFNCQRRCSVFYSYKDCIDFLNRNNLIVIIRAHEVQDQGYKLLDNYNNHPVVCTIFSAPNYCDAYKNYGGIVEFDKKIISIKKISSVQHPFCLPGNVDGINWSYPFVSENILEFTISLIENMNKLTIHNFNADGDICKCKDICTCKNICKDDTQHIDVCKDICSDINTNNNFVKNMVLLRTEREAIDEFEEDSTLDCCVLQNKDLQMDFDEAVEKDKINEIAKDSTIDSNIIDSNIITSDISQSLLPKNIIDIFDINKDSNINEILNNISIIQNDGLIKISNSIDDDINDDINKVKDMVPVDDICKDDISENDIHTDILDIPVEEDPESINAFLDNNSVDTLDIKLNKELKNINLSLNNSIKEKLENLSLNNSIKENLENLSLNIKETNVDKANTTIDDKNEDKKFYKSAKTIGTNSMTTITENKTENVEKKIKEKRSFSKYFC